MRFFSTLAALSVICALIGFAIPAAAKTTAKKSTAKKSTSSSIKKKSPAPVRKAGPKASAKGTARTLSASSKTRSSKTVSSKTKSTAKAVPAATWRNRQQSPTSDRYRDIQQALYDKGYLKSEPSGAWDSESVAAMQHFQADQNQQPTGKITSPALIGLGLGGKSAGASEAAPLKNAPPPRPRPLEVPATPAPTDTPPAQ